jgi:filamin
MIEGPGGKLNPDILPYGMDGYVVKFVPRTPGDYYIRVYWSDLPICLFPLIATVPKGPQDQIVVTCECDGPTLNASQLVLSGQGLVSACVGEPAQFIIDGTRAGAGIPVVRMVGVQDELEVLVEPIDDNVYCCTYQSTKSGAYLLSVLWGDQAAPYSPYKVTIQTSSDVSRVVCSGDGLTSGILGETFNVLVDARRAGVGELSVRCQGPTRPAYCDIEDRHDDTYEVSVRPLELGIHQLFITFGGEQVIGSPFNVRVTSAPDASKVCVSGAGIRNGLLATFQSDFTVDTTQAGPGQLSVKVRARRGAFRVEMRRSAQSDRVIECSYHPTEVGEYFIHVQWSGQHVPCSPFRVILVDTLQELRRLEGGAGGALLPSGGDSDWGSVSKMDGGGPPAGYYIDDY